MTKMYTNWIEITLNLLRWHIHVINTAPYSTLKCIKKILTSWCLPTVVNFVFLWVSLNNAKFLSFFMGKYRAEPWAATLPCLHCFDGGAQSVEEACCATQICFPSCSFPQIYVPLPHENSISVKSCQILRYSALNNRFHFNWPIPRFLPRFLGHGNHRALQTNWRNLLAPLYLKKSDTLAQNKHSSNAMLIWMVTFDCTQVISIHYNHCRWILTFS